MLSECEICHRWYSCAFVMSHCTIQFASCRSGEHPWSTECARCRSADFSAAVKRESGARADQLPRNSAAAPATVSE